jgi:hypothetical protein
MDPIRESGGLRSPPLLSPVSFNYSSSSIKEDFISVSSVPLRPSLTLRNTSHFLQGILKLQALLLSLSLTPMCMHYCYIMHVRLYAHVFAHIYVSKIYLKITE